LNIFLEKGYGDSLGYTDKDYKNNGAEILNNSEEVLSKSNLICKVNFPTEKELSIIKENTHLIVSNYNPETEKKFLNNVKRISKYFLVNLNNIKDEYPNVIKEIRGRGLLIGIQLYKDQANFIKKLMDNRLLTIRAAENVVRVLPPLNVKKNEINKALKIIKKVCSELN